MNADRERLNGMTTARLKDIAKEMGLVGYSKLKKVDLIDLIASMSELRGQRRASPTPSYESFEECVASPRRSVVRAAEAEGVDTTGMTKEAICERIVERRPSSPVAAATVDPRLVAFIERCVGSPRRELEALAVSRGLSVEGKSKRRICEELANAVGARTATEKRKKKTKAEKRRPSAENREARERFVEACVERSRREIRELARKRGIPTSKSMSKREICELLADAALPYDAAKRARVEQCEATTSRERLIDIAERSGVSAAEDSTSEELCDELDDIENQPWPIVASRWLETEWSDIVEDLTGRRESLTPERLAESVDRARLAAVFRATTKSPVDASYDSFRIATELYEYLRRCYLGEDVDEVVERAVADTVADDLVARDIVDEVRAETVRRSDKVEELAEALIEMDVDRPVRAASDIVERTVVAEVVADARDAGRVTVDQADAIVRDVTTAPRCERRPEPTTSRAVSAAKAKDVEALIAELREPKTRASELAVVQRRVYKLLGLVD